MILTTIPIVSKVFPVKKVAALFVDSAGKVTTDLLWRMQQGVADAKFQILKLIVEDDMVPAQHIADVEWEVVVRAYVSQRAIDGEATGGKWIELPVDVYNLKTSTYNREWQVGLDA